MTKKAATGKGSGEYDPVFNISGVISDKPGMTTDELVEFAVSAPRSDELTDEVVRLFVARSIKARAEEARITERDGGWHDVAKIVEAAGREANARGEKATPEALQEATRLSEREVLKAMDSLEFWSSLHGCPEFNWDDWAVPEEEQDERLDELLGEGWRGKWEEA